MISFTSEQAAAIEAIAESTQNLRINAVAGAGKTAVLVEGAKQLPTTKKNLAVAFNVKNREAFQARMPGHVTSLTLNSLGARALRGRINARLYRDKTKTIVRHALSLWPTADQPRGAYAILRQAYVGCRHIGYVPEHLANNNPAVKPLTTEPPFNEPFQTYVDAAIEKSLSESLDGGVIDFDDQIYLPVILGLVGERYTNILVDEAQDLNAIQLHLVRGHGGNGFGKEGRYTFVGDPNQAIYGFRGADEKCFEKIKEMFDTKEASLTFTFRCPQKVTALARQQVPYIQCPDDAPDGDVDYLDWETFHDTSPMQGSAIISRYNKHLIKEALILIKKGARPNYLGGRDLAKELNAVLKDCRERYGGDTPEALTNWLLSEREKAEMVGQMSIAHRAEDIHGCLLALLPNPTEKINQVFAENVAGVDLSTIHKAKGLEWKHTHLLAFDEIERGRGQEGNCWYVGVTRSLSSCTMVGEREDEASPDDGLPT